MRSRLHGERRPRAGRRAKSAARRRTPCLMWAQRDRRAKRAAPSTCSNAAAALQMHADLSPASPRLAPRAFGAGARAHHARPPSGVLRVAFARDFKSATVATVLFVFQSLKQVYSMFSGLEALTPVGGPSHQGCMQDNGRDGSEVSVHMRSCVVFSSLDCGRGRENVAAALQSLGN